MIKKPTPKAKAPAKKPAPKAAPAPVQKAAPKASADAKAFREICTIYSRFCKLYSSVPMLRIDGHSLHRAYLDETGILASRTLFDMDLSINPRYAGIDLHIHADLPWQGSVDIGDLRAPKTEREYHLLRVHLVDLMEKIARDPKKVAALRKMFQRDVEHGKWAAAFLRKISDFSLTY